MTFSALSVLAPAGDWIRAGRKTIEVRRWSPEKWLLRNLLIVQNSNRLSCDGLTSDPDGKVVAMVDVAMVRPWQKDDLVASVSDIFEEGWLAWELQNIRPVDYPLPVSACRKIYEVELEQKYLQIKKA
jgi:hypothetical protein